MMLNLTDSIAAAIKGGKNTFPAIIGRGCQVVTSTYATIEDDPTVIGQAVAHNAPINTAADVRGTGNSAATTEVSISITAPVAEGTTSQAAVQRLPVYALALDLIVPRDSPSPQAQFIITMTDKQGQSVSQTVTIQMDGSRNGSEAVASLLFIPGVNHRGRRVYSPCHINPAYGGADAYYIAATIAIAGSSLSANNQVNVRALTRGHEDVDALGRFFARVGENGGARPEPSPLRETRRPVDQQANLIQQLIKRFRGPRR